MRLLLDTHVLLWWMDGDSPLTPSTRAMIDDGHNQIYISAASLWEITIKMALNKIRAPDDLLEILAKNDITILPISAQSAFAVRDLPLLHRDPFDRLLVAQAMEEDLTIVTHDKNVLSYSVPCMKV